MHTQSVINFVHLWSIDVVTKSVSELDVKGDIRQPAPLVSLSEAGHDGGPDPFVVRLKLRFTLWDASLLLVRVEVVRQKNGHVDLPGLRLSKVSLGEKRNQLASLRTISLASP